MGLRRRLGLRLARTHYVQKAIAEQADLSLFRERPTLRLAIGLGLLAVSMLLGWPAVGVMTGLAIYFDQPLIGIIGGPAIYGFSWVLYLAGLWVAGRIVLSYAWAFNRWAARRGVEKLLGKQGLPAELQPAPVQVEEPPQEPDKS